LLPDDPRATAVAHATHTLAELLTAPPPVGPVDGEPPRLDDVTVLAQPHCHQHAVTGYGRDRPLMEGAGAEVRPIVRLCWRAGHRGMGKAHYDVSVAVAETGILPALRAAEPGTVLLADGFSCRTQADHLAGERGVHLAQLLASRIDRAD